MQTQQFTPKNQLCHFQLKSKSKFQHFNQIITIRTRQFIVQSLNPTNFSAILVDMI